MCAFSIDRVLDSDNLMKPVQFNLGHRSLDPAEVSELECNLSDHGKRLNVKALLGGGKTLTYHGTINHLENSLCQTVALIRNKKSNTVKVVPIQSCIVSIVNDKQNSPVKNSPQVDDEINLSLKRLSHTFGSKRAKRLTDMGFKMNLATNTQTDLHETVSNILVNDDDIKPSSDLVDETFLKLLPPCNRNATDIAEVYLLKDIISDDELKLIKPAAEFLLSNPPAAEDEKSSFFLHSHYLQLGSDPPLWKVESLLYANALLTFINMGANELKTKFCGKTICPFSNLIANKILSEFTVSSDRSRTRPLHLKDKAVCYLIVIVLLFNNYQVHLEKLSPCIKGLGQKKLVQLARTVGIVPSKSSGQMSALKFPLPNLPKVARGRKRH